MILSFKIICCGVTLSRQTCHFAYSWLVQVQFATSYLEHNLPWTRLAVERKLLWWWALLKAKPLSWYLKPCWHKLNWNIAG